MSGPVLSWYDVLDVAPSATAEEIRVAWRDAVAELGPTDRRFRVLNQAAEVLLDPEKRAAHDAELAAAEAGAEAEADPGVEPDTDPEPDSDSGTVVDEPQPGVVAVAPDEPVRRTVPVWLLAGLVVLTALLVALSVWQWNQPSDSAVEDATVAAQSAAERGIVPVLSYDYRDLDDDQKTGQSYLTEDYQEKYDALFEVIRENAANTETVVEAEVLASGIVRSGVDRVQVLLFVNRPTTNKQSEEPVIYKDQVTVTMVEVDGDWLIDDLQTTPLQG